MKAGKIIYAFMALVVIAAAMTGIASATEQKAKKVVLSFNLGDVDKKINDNGIKMKGFSGGRTGGRISSPKAPVKAPSKIPSQPKNNPVKSTGTVKNGGKIANQGADDLWVGSTGSRMYGPYAYRPSPLKPESYSGGFANRFGSSSQSSFGFWPPWYYWWILGSHSNTGSANSHGGINLQNTSYIANITK